MFGQLNGLFLRDYTAQINTFKTGFTASKQSFCGCSLTPKVAKNDSKMAKVKKKMSAEYNHTQSLITV
jgi:hypothetical protein